MLGRPGTLLSGDSRSGAALSLNFLGGTLPGQVSFTRASAANYFNNAGLLTSAAINVPRFDYNPATLALNGLLIEQASTNSALWSRDLTNAAWTTLLGTAAKDQTGIDGVANSASSFVATSGNATTLQTVTHVSSTDNYAVWLKRITGTGEIDITLDGGVTWTNVTAQINSSTWTRVSANESTVVNPAIGLRIVTNGDKIAVDQNQLEIGQGIPTSDIITTTAAVSRSADVATVPTTAFSYNPAASTVVSTVMQNATLTDGTTPQQILEMDDTTSNNFVDVHFRSAASNFSRVIQVSGSQIVQVDAGTALGVGVVQKIGYSWQVGGASLYANNTLIGRDTPASIPPLTMLRIGARVSGIQYLNGWVRSMSYYNKRLPDAQLQALTH